jgi:predicted dehydrogenase
MMSKYRLLLTGCGSAGLCAVGVAEEAGRGKLAAIFDPREAAIKETLSLYPDAIPGDDYVQLLKDTKPDAVIIAGPDHLHAEQAVIALEHGAHLLIEKPLSTTVADARKIIDKAKETGLHVMVDHTERYAWPNREIALAAKEGRAGKIFFVQGDYAFDHWPWYSEKGEYYTPWRIDKNNPQNILFGGGYHYLDLMLWVVGSEVEEVYCYSNKFCAPEFPSDDCLILIFKFENGVLGKCFVSCGCKHPGAAQRIEVFGTEGTLTGQAMLQKGRNGQEQLEKITGELIGGHGWGETVIEFLDLLEGKIENPIPATFAAKTVSLCEAALKSLKSHKPEKPERV